MVRVPEGYYAVIFFEKKSRTYGVKFPNYPGVTTYGRTFDKAVEMAEEALSVALESDFDRKYPLPESHKPRVKRGERIVFISLKAEIRMAYLLRGWRELRRFRGLHRL